MAVSFSPCSAWRSASQTKTPSWSSTGAAGLRLKSSVRLFTCDGLSTVSNWWSPCLPALLIVSLAGATFGGAYADTLRVPSQYPTIQAAVDAASPGDSISVADGLYQETPTIGTNKLTLVSEVAGGALIQEAAPVVSVSGDSVRIVGFRIDSTTFSSGNAALTLTGNDFVVESCLLSRGEPCVLVFSGTGTLRSCTVREGHEGVRVAGFGSDVILEDCDLVANSTSTVGAGLLVIHGTSATLIGCRFIGNYASIAGGGVFAERSPQGGASRVTADRCLFYDNSSRIGAAVASVEAEVTLRSCSIVGNTVLPNSVGGGVLDVEDSQTTPVVVERTIIAFNNGPALTCHSAVLPIVSCSNVFGNNDDGICGVDGGNNINLDPAFCSFESQDFHLQLGSPCAPGQSPPGCGLIGAFDPACVDPVLPTTWGAVKYRFRQKGVSR